VKKEMKEEPKLKSKTPLEEAIGFQIPKISIPKAETKVSLRVFKTQIQVDEDAVFS
jgi:hypothetical protein